MNYIIEALRARTAIFDGFTEVHVFGSAIAYRDPGDIDLVLVYDRLQESAVLAHRAAVADALSVLFPRLPVDLTVLRDDELIESGFLQAVSSCRIKG